MHSGKEDAVVMVVDDTPANLRLLSEILGGVGYRVVEFPRGELALRSAIKTPPDLVLLDILMPGMDGFTVCRAMKDIPALKDIPVLFISALDDPGHKVQGFAAGGVDYVTKPFMGVEVLARVKTHLSLRRAGQQLEQHNLYLGTLVKDQVKDISDSQLSTILALSKLAEHRDDETGLHVERARRICRLLAQKLQEDDYYSRFIDENFISNIFYASSLHDIGKVGISDNILLKPGKLDALEWQVMKTHTTIGRNTLREVWIRYPKNAFISMGVDVAGTHHERWDGTGYPLGLVGEEIPLSGRIMALADVYDALRSKRPYKESLAHEVSCQIILDGAGRQFDPIVVEAFLAISAQCDQIELLSS